jgi:hypothetical protein
MNPDTVNMLLLALGPMIPLLAYVFIDQLVKWQADQDADAESAAADRATLWHLDWAFWSRRVESPNPNTRRLANDMQGFLLSYRDEVV